MVAKQCFKKAKGLFITGTDTGVGKTVVTGAIARCLSAAGKKVGVFKPISTGCRITRQGLISEDAEFLAHCSNSINSLEEINPVRYLDALAPMAAAERSGRVVDFDEIYRGYQNITNTNEIILVEGK